MAGWRTQAPATAQARRAWEGRWAAVEQTRRQLASTGRQAAPPRVGAGATEAPLGGVSSGMRARGGGVGGCDRRIRAALGQSRGQWAHAARQRTMA